MSTEPGPQQPQPAKAIPSTQVLNLLDPPGRIEGPGELSKLAQYCSHPYPLSKPPVMDSTHLPDEDWVHASKDVLIFTHQIPKPFSAVLFHKKLGHFQYYFWTALDRARRLNKPLDGSVQLWQHGDLQAMLAWCYMCLQKPVPARIGEGNSGMWRILLATSPWFDCPLFCDLLWEVVKDGNGQPKTRDNGKTVVKPRSAKSAELEKEFFNRWWLVASKLPLRRFENGDAVLPITVEYYQAQYGTAGMEWRIPPSHSAG
ncbi:hypothetical protein Neosp_001444 [[Neocosmospora] mangrovei]